MSTCDYQELNYTIIFDSVNESRIIEEGPFYHRGPGTLMHDVVSDKLVRGEEYSVYGMISDYSNPNSTRRTINDSYICKFNYYLCTVPRFGYIYVMNIIDVL